MVRWPSDTQFGSCPMCKKSTSYQTGLTPSGDWEARLAAFEAQDAPDTEEAKILRWRLGELLGLGFPWETASELASSAHVELRFVAQLISRGATTEQAYQIVR